MCTVTVSITFQSRGLGRSRHHSTNTCDDNSYYRYSMPRKTIFKYYLKCDVSLTSDVYQLSDVCQCSFSSFPACTRTTVATYVWSSSQLWKKMPAGTPCQPRMTPASYPAPLGLMSTVSPSYHTLLPESSIFFLLYKLFKYFYSFFSSMAAA